VFLDAQVIRGGQEITATATMQLTKDDRIRTGYQTQMAVTFVDSQGKAYGTVVFEELTEVQLGLFLLGNIHTMELWLKVGGMSAEVEARFKSWAADRGAFTVRSPTVTASVRGTRFRVHHDAATQTSTVSVTEGEVLVTPTNAALSPVTLSAGQQVLVTEEGIGTLAAPPTASSAPAETLLPIVVGGGCVLLALVALVGLAVGGVWLMRSRAPAAGPAAPPGAWSPTPQPSGMLPARLTVIQGSASRPYVDLSPGGLLIGRDLSCGLVLYDPQVSGQHARLKWAAGAWVIHDLNSTNGTYVNGMRVTSQPVRPGDQVQIGQTVLVFQ